MIIRAEGYYRKEFGNKDEEIKTIHKQNHISHHKKVFSNIEHHKLAKKSMSEKEKFFSFEKRSH